MQRYAIINTCGREDCCARERDPFGGYCLAVDVDARIAELKQWLEQEIDLHPSQYPDFTGGYCSALEDVLKKFNALMGRSS